MALLTALFVDNNDSNNSGSRSDRHGGSTQLLHQQQQTTPFADQDSPVLSVLSAPSSDSIKHDVVSTMSWQITVLGFIASLAIAINISTCFVHFQFRGRRSNFSSVILAISSLDIIFVAVQLGLSVATFAEPARQKEPTATTMDNVGICTAGSMACRLAVLFPITFILLESSFLAVGAFNRWLAISKPDVPHWVKGRTCLISTMTFFLFLTVAVGINVIRDDIIMVKNDTNSPKIDDKLLPQIINQHFIGASPFSNVSSETIGGIDDSGDYPLLQEIVSAVPLKNYSVNGNSSSNQKQQQSVTAMSYFTFGCTILPSVTALAVVAGISVFYFALLATSIGFLIVTWFHIWSLLPLPSSDGICSLHKMVLRRKPEFVNSKFVDGYKIMWATLLSWVICSVCSLAVSLAPLPASASSTCTNRRFLTVAILFLATLFKCFLYIGFSFTFRRAIFETFVAPCCSRFYRTQNYVVARSSPFDRHQRVAVIGGSGGEHHNGGHHHGHHRQHHILQHFLAEKQTLSPTIIPTVLVQNGTAANGDLGPMNSANIFSRRNNYHLQPSLGFNDPAACFDISDLPINGNRLSYLSPFSNTNNTNNSSSCSNNSFCDEDNNHSTRIAYLSPTGRSNKNGTNSNNNSSYCDEEEQNSGGFGFTSLASLPVKGHSGRSIKRIPIVIDDIGCSHNNAIETISSKVSHRSHGKSASNKKTDSSNKYAKEQSSKREPSSSSHRRGGEDNLSSHSDVIFSAASPQPTVNNGEEENKL